MFTQADMGSKLVAVWFHLSEELHIVKVTQFSVLRGKANLIEVFHPCLAAVASAD